MALDYGHQATMLESHSDFTLDVAPLQKAFLTLAAKVDQCTRENAALRAELAELKVGKRLEALEQGVQELSDTSRPAGFFWAPTGTTGEGTGGGEGGDASLAGGESVGSGLGHSASGRLSLAAGAANGLGSGRLGMPGSMGRPGGVGPGGPGVRGGMVDGNWLVSEVLSTRERLAAMERKAEALWHSQESDEQLRGTMDRLRADLQAMQAGVMDAQAVASAANSQSEKQSAASQEALSYVKGLQDRLHTLELGSLKSNDERRELTAKVEATSAQIWDQLRHVEGSLAQRLTLAETSHVATLQEVDEAKEATSEVLQRVDDVKRHTNALEGKLESFNTQVAAAMNPLHNALAAATERLEALAGSKQDAASALRMTDVDMAVARAIEHADRRGDNLIKAIAGVEARLEQLADSTPNKGEVVLTCDLEALLTEHARELDAHLDKLKGELLTAVASKADREELSAMELRLGGRVEGLEGAILKGLKAISDKVSAALAEKLDLLRFNEFKMQVRAILADVEDRLRDWSPVALGTKAQLGTDAATAGTAGAPTCLCCDSRVRTVRDLKAMGFREDDRVFAPDRVPMSDPLLPSIQGNRAASLGAHLNARLTGARAAADARLRSGTTSLMEPLPAAAGAMATHGTAAGGGSPNQGGTVAGAGAQGMLAVSVDAGAFASLPPPQSPSERMAALSGAARQASARGIKVKVETVSGGIMKGHLPKQQVVGAGGGAGTGGIRAPRSPVAAAATASGLTGMSLGLQREGGVGAGPAAGAAAGVGAASGQSQSTEAGDGPVSPWRSDAPSPAYDTGLGVPEATPA